ncbi:MAG: methionyl-tRNA formyltransferase [Phycisphaerae bacterium]|nr:methionyl-tRNA formyltransferase [Phycisphaerae bacterium]
MRIVFFGSGAFGVPTLGALASEHEVVAVVTQPDRPAGRGRHLAPTPIGAFAAEQLAAVPLLKPEDVNEASVAERLRGLDADAWVVIAFGQKLGRALMADRFAINLHASLLPRWRGAAPINAAILAGDAVTGNTVITLADRMDAGLVLGSTTRPIGVETTAGELHDLLAADGPALVLDVLNRHEEGTLRGEPQDETRVTKAGKLKKEMGLLDWSRPAAEIRRRVHGLNPWPGVSVAFRGRPVKLLRVAEAAWAGEPGRIVDPAAGVVACGGGSAVRIVELQPAGKRPMSWPEFSAGARPRADEVLGRIDGGGAC